VQTNSQKRISGYESPYFYYLRKTMQIIVNFIDCKTTNDMNFRLERSSEGKKIKEFVREMMSRKLVYSQFCCQTSHTEIEEFVNKFEADVRRPMLMKELELIDLNKNIFWEPSSFSHTDSLIEIKTDLRLTMKYSARSASLKDPHKEDDHSRLDQSRADPTPSNKQIEKTDHPIDWNLSNNFKISLKFIENDPITKKVVFY
jgi:hypothetical protein